MSEIKLSRSHQPRRPLTLQLMMSNYAKTRATHMRALAVIALLSASTLPQAVLGQAESLDLRAPAELNVAAIDRVIPDLAARTLAAYERGGHEPLSMVWLQLAAGRYGDARRMLQAVRESGASGDWAESVPLEIFAAAKSRQSIERMGASEALAASFREVFATLDDKRAFAVARQMQQWSGEDMRQAAVSSVESKRQTHRLTVDQAIELSRSYALFDCHRTLGPHVETLIAEDHARRYLIDEDVLIRTPDGATLSAIVVRPRLAAQPLPALLTFSIYTLPRRTREATQTAANGFVGVAAFSRGKRNSDGPIIPYERDGDDARTVIDWISKQPWSDGRVGMWGGSYDGFTQWAAAKKPPSALKAIMSSVTAAPGIDVPMQGNIFVNFVYPWTFYTSTGKLLDDVTYADSARWNELNRRWYLTGSSYRSLDAIDGTPNPTFRRWLDHPDYDEYWQSMIPNEREFAQIDIPVLQTFGYYGDGGQGAIYYFMQHRKHHPRANHVLLVGPYDHAGGQNVSEDVLNGYRIDQVARLNVPQLRYEWFTHLFKGGTRPALLKDTINYEVMGANVWKHAPSLERMSSDRLHLYLVVNPTRSAHELRTSRPARPTSLVQTVDFTSRGDVDLAASSEIISKTLDTRNAAAFVSDVLDVPTEVSGLFAGRLEFETNKKDMDVSVQLFEQMPNGEYFRLSYSQFRASYARDRRVRQLLQPGKRQSLDFRSEILTSRLMQKGSRIVIVLGVLKNPEMQINYGTGKDVSDETVDDAGAPLRIRWFSDSYIDLPVTIG